MMTHETIDLNDGLWWRLRDFPVGGEAADWVADSEAGGLSFSQRLARENDWTLQHARRCVDEYRRFLFLAARAGHSVTPSDAVDQVWHQHLVYTENYWTDLCGDVLPSPLHHGPTRGGQEQRMHFQTQYEKTLDSYRRFFGEPPADIWPPTDERFSQSIASVRVDRRRYWLIPKLRWTGVASTRTASTRTASIAGLAMVPAGVIFPFNLDGPTFLLFYALAIAVGLLVCWIAFYVNGGVASSLKHGQTLGWGQLAVLADGKDRLLQAVLVSLRNQGLIECGESGFVAASPLENGSRDIEKDSDLIAAQASNEVLKRIRESTKPLSLNVLRVSISSLVSRHEAEMQQAGWLRSSSDRSWLFSLVATCAVGLLGIGIVRCMQGLSAGRPIGLLVLEMIVAAGVFAVAAYTSLQSRMTTAGKQLVERHRVKFSRSKISSIKRQSMTDPANLPFIALWGGIAATHFMSDPTDVIAKDMLFGDELRRAAEASSGGGWMNSWSSGGSSGGGDIGGGGDAGCGGGCGGCGGCGG